MLINHFFYWPLVPRGHRRMPDYHVIFDLKTPTLSTTWPDKPASLVTPQIRSGPILITLDYNRSLFQQGHGSDLCFDSKLPSSYIRIVEPASTKSNEYILLVPQSTVKQQSETAALDRK